MTGVITAPDLGIPNERATRLVARAVYIATRSLLLRADRMIE